jgi:phosphate starvation-inducible PhoH-like protein
LLDAIEVLRGIDEIRFVHFDERDVVRHSLVQRIIRAYERQGADRQMPLHLSDPESAPPAVSE